MLSKMDAQSMIPASEARACHFHACDAAEGPLVVLLHGISIGVESLVPLITALLDPACGLRRRVRGLAAINLWGHGGTPAHDGPHDETSVARWLHGLLVSEGHLAPVVEGLAPGSRPLMLVAYSSGCIVAARFVTLHPRLVSRLCLLQPGGIAPDLVHRLFAKVAGCRCLCGERLAAAVWAHAAADSLPECWAGDPAEAPQLQALQAIVRRQARDSDLPRSVARFTAAMSYARLFEHGDIRRLYAAAAALQIPTLLAWTDLWDHENAHGLGRARLEPMFCATPGSEAVTISGAGHLGVVQRADAVAEAVASFLIRCGS